MGNHVSGEPNRDRWTTRASERVSWQRSWRNRVGWCLFACCGIAQAQPTAEDEAEPSADAPPPTASFPSSDPPGEDAPPPATDPPAAAPPTTADDPASEPPRTAPPPAEAESSPAASAPPEPVRGAPITPELLALCTSGEFTVRDYCLTQLELAPELPPAARDVIGNLAATDPNLSARANELYRRAYEAEPPPLSMPPTDEAAPGTTTVEATALPPGDPMRVIYAPTAFTRPAGTVGFNAFELGTLTLDFGVTDNLELGVQTAIPIGFLTFGGLVKVGLPFEGGAVAVRGNVLMIKLLGVEESAAVVYGAGPVLTLGNFDDYFNIGTQFYGFSVEGESASLALPNVGGSVRLSKATRLSGELYLPTGLQQDMDVGFGDFALLLWGIRLFGEHVWGDIALIEPICEGCAEIYQVIPLGIPFLNIGGSW